MATLTYVYADCTAVVGPLAAYAEPHSYDLDRRTAARLSFLLSLPAVGDLNLLKLVDVATCVCSETIRLNRSPVTFSGERHDDSN